MEKSSSSKSFQQKVQLFELQFNPANSNQDININEGKKADEKPLKNPKECANRRVKRRFPINIKRIQNSKCLTMLIQSIFVFIIMSIKLFYILFWRNQIKLAISLPISLIMALFFGIAFGLSTAFRCVIVLCITMITSEQGRIILLSLITSILVGGPLVSIMYNTNQASVTISCLADLSEQYGQSLVDTYKKAYDDMSEAIKENTRAWAEISDGIQTALNPIRSGFKSAEDEFKSVKEKVESAAVDCQNGMEQVNKKCNQGVNDAYNRCKDELSKIPGIFKEPVNVVKKGLCKIGICVRRKRDINDVCNLVSIGSSVCEPFEQLNICQVLDTPKFVIGPALSSIIDLCSQFSELFDFELELSNSASSKTESTVNGTIIKQKIREEFQENYALILYAIDMIRIILILPILIVPISMSIYLNKYLKLQKSGKSGQLSRYLKMKKRQDKRQLTFQLVQLVSHILFSLSVICFDFALFWIEDVVKTHGNATFSAEGAVQIDFETKGGPILKPFIDQFVKTFAFKRTQNFTINTDHCLPEPMNASGLNTIVPVFIIYILAIVFVFIELRIASYRPKIINHFYPNTQQTIPGFANRVDTERKKFININKK